MPIDDFRFSPRPNRAGEIAWEPWGSGAFSRAAAEDKPILLAISAVWCHWCHVMDETTYSDPGVIDAINRRFVAVRVDNDRRPDINARYNMGGWPTTAFLTPDGTTLTGATYLPPHQMQRALDEIAQFYAQRKDEIAQHETVAATLRPAPAADGPGELNDAPIVALVDQLERTYDEEYGGFGDAPKFPQPDVLEFLLSEWRYAKNQRLYVMVAKTMLAMARGGMYDHVEGGFFRYSTTRDWSVPHFEKMAEDHAGLIRILAALELNAPTRDFRATLVSATNYVRTTLHDPQLGLFAGSQDADEAYFALPLEERRARAAPFVDRTSYTNWTCGLAGAQCLAARALDDDGLLREAVQTLDNVHERLLGQDGLLYHVLTAQSEPQTRGLLVDHVAYLRALLDAHEISGQGRFLERAEALADRIDERLASPEGVFYDRLPDDDAFGRLALLDRPIIENGLAADALLRLDALADRPADRERARRILAYYAAACATAGSFGATYARALRRLLSASLTVRIVGDPAATDAFREAAVRLPAGLAAVRTLTPPAAVELGMPPDAGVAYVCSRSACGAPIRQAGGLRAGFETLR